ncbi:MAG TPA: hypothetical protein VMP00_14070 [Burkholderiales bacterium]|nr:hypothetical protein [Burkholderiales bacterium]
MLSFKAERDYLQGGDICQAVMERAESRFDGRIDRLQLGIHRFMHRQPDMHWHDHEAGSADPARPAVDFVVSSRGATAAGWLEESQRPVLDRIPFDEEQIRRLCEFRADSVEISGDSGYLPIEVAVSMTKQLHNRMLPAQDGRWIFTRIDLRRALRREDASSLCLKLIENLYSRLTKSSIGVAGEEVGYMYFSLLRR